VTLAMTTNTISDPMASVLGILLLPAVLELLGRRTWRLPRSPSRRLPTVQLRPPSEPTPALETS
jgi:hypothetical protein